MSDAVDLIVIGAGMAGMNAAGRAVDAGARVALIERGRVGGTCPTRGCIPTKALIRSAEIAHEIRGAEEFGIRVGGLEVDFAAVMDRVRGIIDRGSRGAQGWLESLPGLELIHGEAAFEGPGAVRVDGRVLTAPRVVVASGAEPASVPIPGLSDTPHLTSDDVLALDEMPRRLLVVGAGPIALELGQALGRLGAEVTMVEVADAFLAGSDREITTMLRGFLEEEGLRILVGATIHGVNPAPGGGVEMGLTHDGQRLSLEADALLLATGRAASTGALALEAAGVERDRRGITVDARLRTSATGIWAAGDVLGPEWGQFTHVARRQGVDVTENALGIDPHDVPADVGPRAVFTDPELVSIGLTEDAARAAGHAVSVGTGRFSGGKARAWGEERGMARVVAKAGTGRILGAHVLGYHAADLIHPVAVAMQAGDGTGAPIARAFHIHPTFGEVVKSAVEASQPR
ncbi:MAG: NAD(P)/FAD-dependent oxidoreductase [Thermoleophilia bacterium]